MTISDTPLSRVRVADAMHTGILTTDSDTPLRVVARLMATQHVHAIAIADPDYAQRPYRFVTTLDVAVAAAEDTDPTAGQVAGQAVLFVSAADSLGDAASRFLQRGASHAVVVDPDTAHPVGVLSTLDIAAAYSG